MIHAYRYRLYPTEEQKVYFAKAFGCARYAYNYCVREHERVFKEEGKTLSAFDMMKSLREFKKGKTWLDEADSQALQWIAMRVMEGYRRYFKKTNSKPPHEHKKREETDVSYTTNGMIKVYFGLNLISIPIIGPVRARLHRRFYGQIKNITIKRMASGAYYASICVNEPFRQPDMKPFNADKAVGIDMGVHHFLTLSDGTFVEMPDVSREQNRKAFLQRRLKHQQPNSKGYERTKRQIARLSERITNIRHNFHYKTATEICDKYDAICVETLNVRGMLQKVGKDKDAKNRGFNRKLSNVGMRYFLQVLELKAKATGTHFSRVDRWEPTTKRCHVCGYINNDINLSTREWTCPQCGTHHDRDINAAINIKNYAKPSEPLVDNDEQPLDAEIIAKQLPPVGRNVMLAKNGDIAKPRTRKVTDKCVRRPASQIDNGTTRPRLAFSFDPVYALRANRFAKDLDVSVTLVETWLTGNKGQDIVKWNRFIEKLMELSDNCRKTLISSDVRLETSNVLHEMNEYVHMERLTKDTLNYDKPFYWWRVVRKTDEEIDVINKIYSEKIPEMIDKFVEEYVFQK